LVLDIALRVAVPGRRKIEQKFVFRSPVMQRLRRR
jgi:hypothetical protein